MTIHLKADQEDRIAEAVRSGAYKSPDEVIDRALEVLHAHDQWLTANRQTLGAKIRRGIEELDRGEGIPYTATTLEDITQSAFNALHLSDKSAFQTGNLSDQVTTITT